jgi:cellulose synthase/poly-beta-1,6-N-acetylglucosamine synthase-like glycosyltransferase
MYLTSILVSVPAENVLLTASICLSIAFFIYGLNTLHLTRRVKRYREPFARGLSERPAIAIHLPIYNELYVVGRLLEACTRVASRYGRDLVRIYIVDDSSDETVDQIDKLVSGFTKDGFQFTVIRRSSREGFKAGALQAALKETTEPYFAVLDADFVPPEDFLDRTVPFMAKSEVGFVQSRWGHIDRDYNTITESIAIGVDAHFLVEQQGRNGSGYLMNFNGSAGLLRTEAVAAAGGWAADTLAEDLDVSYRMQLVGYKGVYLNGVEVPGELPPTITSLKRQQGRWARGSIQTAKKLLGRIRKSKELSIGQKLEAGIHLTYYMVHPLMVASFLLAVAATLLNVDVISYAVNVSIPSLTARSLMQSLTATNLVFVTVQVAPWLVFSILIVLSTIAVLYYCVEAIRVQKLGLFENIKEIALLVILGYGMSISNSVQVLSGLGSKKTGAFLRTPKYAITRKEETWRGKKYQIPLNATNLFEAGGVTLGIIAVLKAVTTGNLGIVPILVIYLAGYSLVLSLTILQTFRASGTVDL